MFVKLQQLLVKRRFARLDLHKLLIVGGVGVCLRLQRGERALKPGNVLFDLLECARRVFLAWAARGGRFVLARLLLRTAFLGLQQLLLSPFGNSGCSDKKSGFPMKGIRQIS